MTKPQNLLGSFMAAIGQSPRKAIVLLEHPTAVSVWIRAWQFELREGAGWQPKRRLFTIDRDTALRLSEVLVGRLQDEFEYESPDWWQKWDAERRGKSKAGDAAAELDECWPDDGSCADGRDEPVDIEPVDAG